MKDESIDIIEILQTWFSEARLRLSNKIKAELKLPEQHNNTQLAALWLYAGDGNLEDIRCHLAVAGSDSIDPTILAYTKAISPYAAIEYIVENMNPRKNLRCKDIMVKNLDDLKTHLDECLDDFILLTKDV